MAKPLIQIDDEIREMTDEEYQQYIKNSEITTSAAEIADE